MRPALLRPKGCTSKEGKRRLFGGLLCGTTWRRKVTTVYSSDKSCAVVETSPKWQERPVYGTIATEPERSVIRLLKTSEMGRFPARLAAPSPTPSKNVCLRTSRLILLESTWPFRDGAHDGDSQYGDMRHCDCRKLWRIRESWV